MENNSDNKKNVEPEESDDIIQTASPEVQENETNDADSNEVEDEGNE